MPTDGEELRCFCLTSDTAKMLDWRSLGRGKVELVRGLKRRLQADPRKGVSEGLLFVKERGIMVLIEEEKVEDMFVEERREN